MLERVASAKTKDVMELAEEGSIPLLVARVANREGWEKSVLTVLILVSSRY